MSELQQQQQQEEQFNIDEVFESAVTIIQNLPKEGPIKPSDSLKLKLYALFKQATHGPNDTPKPKFYQFVESYKWDAWRRLGDMSREDAMAKYIDKLKKIMDTIPAEEANAVDNKQFEDILGKKFYDYWFNEWNARFQESIDRKDFLLTTSHSQETGLSNISSTNDHLHHCNQPSTLNLNTAAGHSNDTHSDSSGDSSLSMLDEAQSVEADGYKTPISLEECNITGQMRDQFSLAVLRLQHGLEETNSRLNRVELLVRRATESIQALENQTYAKQTTIGGGGGMSSASRACCDCRHGAKRVPAGANKLISFVRQMDAFHWFYLSYPLLVYMAFRVLERRQRRNSPR